MPNSIQLELRAASLAPTTFNAEANTVEVVLSTGADVNRGGYIERLPTANADLRDIEGKPVLDAHNQGSTRAVLGVIEKAWRKDGEIRARLKLSSRDDVAGIVGDIRDGILRSISIGYRVTRWADSTDSKGQRFRTALAWSIHEASIVPIPADPGAKVRSNPMPKKNGANPAPEADVIDTPANEPTVAETRAEIRAIMKRAGATPEQADELIDADATVEQARAAAYDLMTERTNRVPRVRLGVSHEDPAALIERQVGGLYARASGTKPEDSAREFAGLAIADHASLILQRAGVRTFGMTREQILTRALGTSDLPNLLQGVGNRALLAKYGVAQSPLVSLAKKGTLPDFREAHRLRAGEFGALEELGEHGEIKHTSREESKLSISVKPYARRIDYSMKAMLNDDLSALTDASEQFGIAAAARDADELIAVINANPAMDDGFNLFSADHNNTRGWGSLSDIEAISVMTEIRLAMRSITGLDGSTLLNIVPKHLVVSKEMETQAEMFLANYQAQSFSETNPFQSKLTLMVEPRLAPYQWYVFADPALAPVLELAHLAGREGPQIETQQAWDTWGVSFRCIHVVGAAAIGWRGAYRVENGDPGDSNSAGNN
jgi:hypothetical protein